MDGFNYAPAVALANRLISKYGRTVTFTMAGPGGATATATAVFVGMTDAALGSMLNVNEGLWRECQQVMLVAPDGVNDFTAFTFITDADGKDWKRSEAQTFKPGDTVLLYFIGVVR